MNGLISSRLAAVALVAILTASALAACGDDDDGPVTGIESGTTGKSGGASTTGENGQAAGGGGSANGPASAGDRNPDAPDNGISEKPGGPDQSQGNQKNDKGNPSGGIKPPTQPSPALP